MDREVGTSTRPRAATIVALGVLALSGPLHAETPTVEQLYDMVKQLQANQERLLRRLDEAERDARTARRELDHAREELARAKQLPAPVAQRAEKRPEPTPDPDLPGILLGQKNGWAVSTDGRVNAYMVNISGDAPPAGANTGGVVISGDTLEDDIDSFRVRTGFNPSALGLNIRAPDHAGHRIQARLGLYPSIQNDNLKNSNTNLDIREVYFTISRDDWGELLFGRALSLFQRQHVILDMEGIGVGATGARGNGTTAGRVGFGYLYNNFAPSFRYTTPDLDGLKFSIGLYDPSEIRGPTNTGAATQVSADVTDVPRVESELTWNLDLRKGLQLNLFASSLWQKAEFDANTAAMGLPATRSSDSVTARGVGYGGQLKADNWDLVLAGYTGEALGTLVMLDGNALDGAGGERDHDGWYAQYRYDFTPRFGSGVAWGESNADATAFDRADFAANGTSYLEQQSNWSLMSWYRLTDYLTFMAQFTQADTDYTFGRSQDNSLMAVGAILSW